MRLVLFASIAVFAACAANADPLKDGTVQLKPGLYNWKQKTEVVGFGSKEENNECLIPEKAAMTLSKLVRELEEGCGVDNVVRTAKGYSFKMVCTGKIPGTAQASLEHTQTSMTIQAKGSATVAGFIPAGFSARADATYIGECSPEEIAKETARYREENPS